MSRWAGRSGDEEGEGSEVTGGHEELTVEQTILSRSAPSGPAPEASQLIIWFWLWFYCIKDSVISPDLLQSHAGIIKTDPKYLKRINSTNETASYYSKIHLHE